MSPSCAARARVALLAGRLAVLALAGAATLSAQGTAPPAPPPSEQLETRQTTPRPFEHAVHRDLSCRQCHVGGPRHRRGRIWTASDCASCHHDPERGRDCAACHRPADFAGPRLATATMALSVWDEPRVRELPFDHARHEQPCSTCHQTGATLAPRECSTCHVEHTSAGVECVTCHRPPAPAVHDVTAHLTCTGARCHTGAATERPMLARASCLVCHQEQKEHRPGRECAGCHFLPRSPPASGPWRDVPSRPAPAPR